MVDRVRDVLPLPSGADLAVFLDAARPVNSRSQKRKRTRHARAHRWLGMGIIALTEMAGVAKFPTGGRLSQAQVSALIHLEHQYVVTDAHISSVPEAWAWQELLRSKGRYAS